MAEMEYKAGVKIDTGESQVTIKQLKKQVQELTTLMDNLTAGTVEYDKTVTELVRVQTQLETAMKAGKSQLSAQEGSYNALSNEMAALKKVMKATTDEAKRMQLSDKINEINDVLKEMDKAQGVHSRNVGNYEESIVNAYQRIRKEVKEYQAAVLNAEEGTEEYEDAMNKLSQAQFELRDMNEKSRYAVADLGEQLSNVSGIASGLMGGFNALQGAMALCGAETEEFEKVMVKLQAGMAIVQGLQGLEGVKDRMDGLITSIKTVTKTMGKAGWIGIIIAVVAAIGLLIEKLTRTNRQIENGVWGMKKLKEITKEGEMATAELVVTTQLFSKISTDVNKAYDVRLKAADKVLTAIGLEINETNRLKVMNGELVDSIDDVIRAYAKQEAAKAAIDKLVEAYKNMVDIAEGSPNFWDKMFTWDISSWFDGDKAWWNDDDFGADRQDKRWEKAKKQFEALKKAAEDSGVLEGLFGGSDSAEDAAAQIKEFVDKEIAELERANERQKALALASAKTEEEKAEIESSYASSLANKKIAILTKYQGEAEKLGDKGYKIQKELSDRIYEIETGNIVALSAERERIKNKDIETVQRYFEILETNTDLYYDEEAQRIENEILAKEERDLKLIENEEKRLQDEQALAQEKYEWLLLNEKDNADEILKIKDEMYRRGLGMLQLASDKEIAIRKANAAKIQKEINKIENDYRKSELDKATDFYPEQENNGFWETLFGSTSKEKKYQEEVFADEQNYFEERTKYLEELKGKYEELLLNATSEEERLMIEQDIADAEIAIQQNKYEKEKAIRDKNFKDEQEKQKARVELVNATMAATSSILNSIADMYEANGVDSEKEAKKIKNLRIAGATIDMIQGAITAYATAQSLGVPMGPIVGGINAAAVIAMGLANIAKIKNTDISLNSAPSSSVGASVSPNPSTYSSDMPASYTRQLTGASEIEELNRDTRVYILESDIQQSNKKVQIRQSESSF